MKRILIFAALLVNFFTPSQCTDKVRTTVVRQERYNGCGSDFIGADMQVTYRLTNNSDHPIYVFGFSYDHHLIPQGYVLRFDEKTQGWQYPTGNNKPVAWPDVSSEFKSVRKIDAGKSIEFGACHSTAEQGKKFARSVYISCDPKSIPEEFISDGYTIASLK